MHRKLISALVGCLLTFQLIIPAHIVLAQIKPPTRLTDIQTSNPGSGLNGFVEFNGEVYFSATDANGPGIWKTDGTTGNTIKVLDDFSLASYSYSGSPFTIFKDALFFVSWDGIVRMTGTPGEYQLISAHAAQNYRMAVLGDHLFYINGPVNVGVNTYQMQLWRTDGSAAGTEMVASTSFYNEGLITPGGIIAVFENRLYFQFNTPTDGELWRSDGTPEGTGLFVDINPSGESYPSNFFEFDGRLFFTANHPDTGYELWVTDGTEAGTHLFMDVSPGSSSSSISNLTSVNNILYFTGKDSAVRTRLWKSDGTPMGTEIMDVIKATTAFHQNTFNLTAADDRLFFFANSTSKTALWVTDGTLAGTQWLHDMSESLNSLRENELAVVSGKLFFSDDYKLGDYVGGGGSFSTRPTELWVSDGTAGGTNLVKEVSPYQLISYGNLLLFSGSDLFNFYELWRSDGSPAGTQMVKNINNVMNTQYPGILVPSNFGLYFVPGGQRTQTLLYPIWKSDGSVAGTVPLPGNGICEETRVWLEPAKLPHLATIGDILYYPGLRCDLWRTDGTVEGTWKVPGDIPHTYDNPEFTLMPVGDLMLFVLDYYGSKELWVTDGTQDPSGTEKIKQLGAACDKVYLPVAPVTYKNEVYFITTPNGDDCDDNVWWKLWKSDGTSDGTQVVKMGGPFSDMWEPKFLALAGDLLFFLANDNENQNRYLLWESDGTTPGTRPVDLISREPVANMVGSDDYLYIFSNQQPCYGCWSPMLYKTRGKDRGGVQLVHAFTPYTLPPYSNAHAPHMVSTGTNLYFTYNIGELPHQLWVSDGTSSGTRIVLTTRNQPVYASNLHGAGGRLFFTGQESVDVELWTSDGTPSGTYQVADINSGSENPSYPDNFTWANRSLFFYANNGVEGVELWVTYQLSLLTNRLNLPLIQR